MEPINRICIVVGLVLAGCTLAMTYAGVIRPLMGDGDTDPIPSDVLARSDVARAHMKQIAAALYAYAAGNADTLPTDLSMLYPAYISNPRVFWHPGDSNPQPTTIDNNAPNQPNSTRISFAFTSADSINVDDNEPLVWDNSATNNGGHFVNTLTFGNMFRTNPAWITPTPTRRELARRNLRSLVLECLAYANGNMETLPLDLIQLAPWRSPSTFWNPGDSDAEPTAITNSIPNAPNSAQISFAYLGGTITSTEVFLLDNSFANNEGGSGVLVGRTDGSATFFEKNGRCNSLSATARSHLQQIGAALLTYAADNLGHFPPKLSMLYPARISDPTVFWNPGDKNPCPTTINNDLPNAANSAQVSFRYLGADYTTACNPLVVLALDNSLSNNSSTGINMLTADGAVACYAPAPPSCQHPPTCSAIAAANLRRIGMELEMYAADNRGYYPLTLSMLSHSDPAVFWNPGDSDPAPLTIDNDVPNQPNSAQISFEYLGPGPRWGGDPWEIVVRDNSPANNAGRGINVLYYDGHTGFIANITPASLAIAGPEAVPAGGFDHYTCAATYSDGTTWDVTNYATWSVTSGPGGVSEQGTYAPPLSVPQSALATLHASYTEGGVTRQADKFITVTAQHDPFADADGDGDVDAADFAVFQRCLSPSGGTVSDACRSYDRPVTPGGLGDGDVDQDDFLAFMACASGPALPAAKTCDD